MIKIGQSLVLPEKLNKIIYLLNSVKNLKGSICEVGVYKGGTAKLIAQNTNDPVYLFDTFEGMPYYTENVDKTWKIGSFNDIKYEEILDFFKEFKNVKILKGIFPKETSNAIENETFKFIHLDVDNYLSYKECLEFLYEKLVVGGIMVFDDYNCDCCKGANIAIDEFFLDKKENLIIDKVIYIIKK